MSDLGGTSVTRNVKASFNGGLSMDAVDGLVYELDIRINFGTDSIEAARVVAGCREVI